MNENAPPPQGTDPGSGPVEAEPGMANQISSRVAAILDAVEREAGKLREEARREAALYFEQAKLRADALVAERQRRIGELSDELVRKSEAVVSRLEDAAPVQQGFENLVRALGGAAERLSHQLDDDGRFVPPPFAGAGAAASPDPGPAAPTQSTGHLPGGAEAAPIDQGASLTPPASGFTAQPHPARAPSQPAWQPAESPAVPSGQAPSEAVRLDHARIAAIQLASTGASRGQVRDHLHSLVEPADAETVLDEIFGAGTRDDARVPWASGPR